MTKMPTSRLCGNLMSPSLATSVSPQSYLSTATKRCPRSHNTWQRPRSHPWDLQPARACQGLGEDLHGPAPLGISAKG